MYSLVKAESRRYPLPGKKKPDKFAINTVDKLFTDSVAPIAIALLKRFRLPEGSVSTKEVLNSYPAQTKRQRYDIKH